MRKTLLLLSILVSVFFIVGLLIAPDVWARPCPGGGGAIGDSCEEVDEREPLGTGGVSSVAVLEWGCSSNGEDRTCDFSYNFAGASQLYKFDYQNIRNDDPTPVVYWCINDTNVWGPAGGGVCSTIQDSATGNIGSLSRGINLASPDRMRYFMVKIRTNHLVGNNNDFIGQFTVYRREMVPSLDSLSSFSITQGDPRPSVVWGMNNDGNVQNAVTGTMFSDTPSGSYSWSAPASAPSGWTIPMNTSVLGNHNFALRLFGPGRNGPETIEKEFNINVTSPSTSITPKYKCITGGSCVRDDTNGTYATSNCNNSCSAVGRYKCLSSNSCGWVSGVAEAGLPDQCSIATAASDCYEDNGGGDPPPPPPPSGGYECSNNSCVWNSSRNGSSCTNASDCLVVQEYCASYVGQSVPAIMNRSQTYPVSVTMKNCGSNTWNSGQNYKLGSENPVNNWTWGTPRAELPNAVPNGQTQTINFNVTAPSSVGSYDFQWRMLKEYYIWFGDYTPNLSISVVNPGSPLPAQARYSCSGESCVRDDAGSYSSSNCNNECVPLPPPPTHAECSAGSCVVVAGAGLNQCSSNSECNHTEWQETVINGQYVDVCVNIASPGTNSCSPVGSSRLVERCTLSISPNRLVIPPTATTTLSYVCQPGPCSILPPASGSPNVGIGSVSAAPTSTINYVLSCGLRSGGSTSATAKVRVYNFSGGKLIEVNPGGQ